MRDNEITDELARWETRHTDQEIFAVCDMTLSSWKEGEGCKQAKVFVSKKLSEVVK